MKPIPMVLSCICFAVAAETSAINVAGDSIRTAEPRKKVFQTFRPPKDWVLFEVFSPGIVRLFQRTTAPGIMVMEEDGVRFTPVTQSPEGYLPQEEFKRIFWVNFVIRDIFIPYSEIKSVGGRFGTIKTKEGFKYKFYCSEFKERFRAALRARIKR